MFSLTRLSECNLNFSLTWYIRPATRNLALSLPNLGVNLKANLCSRTLYNSIWTDEIFLTVSELLKRWERFAISVDYLFVISFVYINQGKALTMCSTKQNPLIIISRACSKSENPNVSQQKLFALIYFIFHNFFSYALHNFHTFMSLL